jgi:tRNA pseudouridine55 synthase
LSAGIAVVDKPAGLTSHDVVARIRRLAGTRKVGHAGTLDPMATGVLVVGIGQATRLLGHLMLTEKAYDATIRLGVSTTTDDAEGEVVSTASAADVAGLDEAHIRAAIPAFVGDIEQVPSSVSAIKVGGRRAYQRVRDGERVELKARSVRVHEIVVHEVRGADVDVSVRCGSGTYVRAIARDLGAALGVGGHLTALRRTAVGPFTLAEARPLDDVLTVLPMADVVRRSFPVCDLDEERAAAVRFGRRLATTLPAPGPVGLFGPDGELLAIYEQHGPLALPVAVFAVAG